MAHAQDNFTFNAADEAATTRLAGWLASCAQPGWLVRLEGHLGVGKTAFARGFIRAKSAHSTIVPSPTFTLLQPYETAQPPIIHADLYRLSDGQEIDELGLVEALDQHVCLVEWAERAADFLPQANVTVVLQSCDDDDRRLITITAERDIIARLQQAAQRDTELVDFLTRHGWGDARRMALAGDASTRRYERLINSYRDSNGDSNGDTHERTAILMDWANGPDGPAIYDGQPYSAVAHLAEAMPAYCAMIDWLAAHDLAVPPIGACDVKTGFLLMDDFGDRHIANDSTIDRPIFYHEALANLLHLHRLAAADFLAAYDGAVQAVEASLFTDWYLPWCGISVDAAAIKNWQALWQKLGDSLLDDRPVTVLRDYHSVNLLWRDAAQARYRVGLIDVQDALAGHAAYDVASLLCDARVDVDAGLREAVLADYLAARFGDDAAARDGFARAYAICAVQRNVKIAGIFVRLAERDMKPGYLNHLPRIISYIQHHLAHPALAEIAGWLEAHAPQWFKMPVQGR